MEKGKKKTGIMGGTFNPIHIGHLLLAENAKDTFGLDEVLFIPSGFSYMKKGMEMADKRIRLEMTQLAIEDNPSFLLSPVEVERERPETIFQNCVVLAAVRNGKDNSDLQEQMACLKEKYGAEIGLVPMDEISISSTDIRNRIHHGKSIRYMVPDNVISYIEKHRLYMG